MISIKILVYSLWMTFMMTSSIAEECLSNNENSVRIEAKPFIDQLRDIEDMLRMFIAIINRASMEKALELNIPGTTPPMPDDTKHESLEELFDKFELATRSFRERFLFLVKDVKHSFVSKDEKSQNENGTELDDRSKYDLENEESEDEYSEFEKVTWYPKEQNTAMDDSSFEVDLKLNVDENGLKEIVGFLPRVEEMSDDDSSTIIPITNRNGDAFIAEIAFNPTTEEYEFLSEAEFTIDEESADKENLNAQSYSTESTEENELIEETTNTLSSTIDDYDPDNEMLRTATEEDSENVEAELSSESDKGKQPQTGDSVNEESATKEDSPLDDKRAPVKIRKIISSQEDLLEVTKHIKRVLDKYIISQKNRQKRQIEDDDFELSEDSEGILKGWRRFSLNTEDKMLNALNPREETDEDIMAALLLALNEQGKLEEFANEEVESVYETSGEYDRIIKFDRSGLMAEGKKRGIPGIDHPNYSDIPPHTSFTCNNKKVPGLYADEDTDCQVFHACWRRTFESYLCPSGFIFNQEILSCDDWYNVSCNRSRSFYYANQILTQMRARRQDYITYRVEELIGDTYVIHTMPFHPIFKQMKILPETFTTVKYKTRSQNTGRRQKSKTEVDRKDARDKIAKELSDKSQFSKRKQEYEDLPKPIIAKPKQSSKLQSGMEPNTEAANFEIPLKVDEKQMTQSSPNVVTEILPSTKEMLIASYSKLYKPKKN